MELANFVLQATNGQGLGTRLAWSHHGKLLGWCFVGGNDIPNTTVRKHRILTVVVQNILKLDTHRK